MIDFEHLAVNYDNNMSEQIKLSKTHSPQFSGDPFQLVFLRLCVAAAFSGKADFKVVAFYKIECKKFILETNPVLENNTKVGTACKNNFFW